LTNPPGHLWRDKWTNLSGPLPGTFVGDDVERTRHIQDSQDQIVNSYKTVRTQDSQLIQASQDQILVLAFRHMSLKPFKVFPLRSAAEMGGTARRRESETVARCATLGRSQNVCKGSRFTVEGDGA